MPCQEGGYQVADAGPGAGCMQGWGGPLLGGAYQLCCGHCSCCGVAVAIIATVAAVPMLLLGWLHLLKGIDHAQSNSNSEGTNEKSKRERTPTLWDL